MLGLLSKLECLGISTRIIISPVRLMINDFFFSFVVWSNQNKNINNYCNMLSQDEKKFVNINFMCMYMHVYIIFSYYKTFLLIKKGGFFQKFNFFFLKKNAKKRVCGKFVVYI